MLTRDKELINEEAASFEDIQTEPMPPTDIVSYNELRSCADLFRLYESKKLEVKPDFQRDVVWKSQDQTRFIDSLAKQLPIPSMCFSLDFKTQSWKVIDGLQRMSTLINFLGHSEYKLNDLEDIHVLLRNNTNIKLKNGDNRLRNIYETIQNTSIPITVIRCDYSKESHMQYLFTIFHRLNAGGVRLNNQEIRNCIFSGPLNTLLKNFDKDDNNWCSVKKRIWGSMDRMRSVEVILRVLAFSECLHEYDGNLASFLNKFMQRKTKISQTENDNYGRKLLRTSKMLVKALENLEKKKMSLTLIEALFVSIYVNIEDCEDFSKNELHDRLKKMREKPSFSENARYAVSSSENVRIRLGDAIDAFKK